MIRSQIKRKLGIYSFAVWKKKKIALLGRLVYRKKYTVKDLISVMKSMGLKTGDVVFIHCSMTEFYNYMGTPDELIKSVIDVIGPEGTLCMPAYPKYDPLKECFFDVINTPTSAGLLAETFRLFPGVLRSINLQHSVCAYGKWAEYLVKDHHHSYTCWDENSPYYKLTKLNAKVFSLGLEDAFIGTVFHCVDSLLYKKMQYFTDLFNHEISYNYVGYDGLKGEHRFISTVGINRVANNRKKVVDNFFDKSMYSRCKLSNLQIKVFDAAYVVERLTELAYQGITVYSHPKPTKNKFVLINDSQ